MSKEKKQIYLVGIGLGTVDGMTIEARRILKECDAIIGAKRMLEAVKSLTEDKITFTSYQVEEIKEFLNKESDICKAAIVLSGDTGFYSGAKQLAIHLEGDYHVTQLPGISSVVALAAKLHTSWEDAKFISIHGRQQNYISAIAHHEKVFLLLGNEGAGREFCEKLCYYGLGDVEVSIGSHLSSADEKLLCKRADELTPQDVSGLSVAMVVNLHPDRRIARHLEDDEFIRGKVPMTKSEVRAISIAKLRLTKNAILYDVGAGTGSVGIEAALQDESIRVYAIEKNPDGVELIRKNSQRFQTDQVQVVEGTAPEALDTLEAPTHVFIGGSSGNLKEILTCVRKKNPDAHIVLNAISMETVMEIMEAEKEQLLGEIEMVQIMAARSKKVGSYHMMDGQNPIYIISQKEEV